MLSGRRLDLLDPSPNDIEIEDIAHGLARVARWNGQTVGEHAFSVAQHALLVEEIATAMQPDLTRRWRLAALLHDAPEYVIGDLISPFKAAIGLDYKAFENELLEAIHRRFGLPPSLPDRITMADQDGRPHRGLLRGDAARGLYRGGSQPLLRRAARRAASAARAPRALDPVPVADRAGAVSGAFQASCRASSRLAFISAHESPTGASATPTTRTNATQRTNDRR